MPKTNNFHHRDLVKTERASPASGRLRWLRAFTLIETMIALAILGIGTGLLYQCLVASMVLTSKNTALNNGNVALQQAYYRLLNSVESSALLVDCANYDPSSQTFTAVASGSWGNSLRFMRQWPIVLYIRPTSSSVAYSPTNPPSPTRNVPLSSQIVLFYFNASLYSSANIPTSARFYPAFPAVTETVTTGHSPGLKPGLGISGWGYNPGELGIFLTNGLGTNSIPDCNRAYLLVESAYAVTTAADGHKELVYFNDTSITDPTQAGGPVVICRYLDGSNQTQANDASIPSGGTPGTFRITPGGDTVQTLLPIRSREYMNLMSRQGSPAAQNNTWLNLNTKFRLRQDL